MSDEYNEFMSRFQVRNIKLNRDYDRKEIISGFNTTASYYNNHRETFDIEIARPGFEELVSMSHNYDKLSRQQRDEDYLRRKHPAISDAYEKYLLLVALHR